jgi:hypothetical protein
MEKVLIVDDRLKKRIGVICFMPAVCFFISLVYYLVLLFPLTQGHPQPESAVGITSRHYNTLFLLLAISSCVSASVLLYCIVYMVRIKSINTPTKMIWMLLLLIVPVSFILFWNFIVRREPKEEPVYPNIA